MTESLSSNPCAWLHIEGQGDQEESSWPLRGDSTIGIGRSFTNDVILPDSSISRRHSMLQVDGDCNYTILDMGSANGTFVNRKMIQGPTLLHSGDTISLGSIKLIFQQDKQPLLNEEDTVEDAGEQTAIFLQKETVSVLICDIRGYTSLAEEIGDKQISSLLQLWSRAVSKVVEENGGRVDKFIGDAVMAVWSDQDGPRQTDCALRAAGEIQYLTNAVGKRLNIQRSLQVWVSLNTGPGIQGNIGVSHNRDYTIVGDVVNVAFRLEEIASQLKSDVLVGENSFQHLTLPEEHFTPHTVTIRGKSEQFQCYGCSFAQLYRYLKK